MTTKEEHLYHKLSEEVFEALTQAQKRKGGLNVEILAQTLGERKTFMDLVDNACKSNKLEVLEDNSEQNYIDLQKKYKEVSEELRHADALVLEIEEAFKNLVSVLASIATDPGRPSLSAELKILKQDLKRKAVPSRIESSANKLKTFVLKSDDDGKSAKTQAPGPESVEESIRDILEALVNDIIILEDENIRKKAKTLTRKIRNEFTLEEYKPFVEEIKDLIFGIKEIVRREKRELYQFSQEILNQLEDTEKDLLKNMEGEAFRINVTEVEFEKQVAIDIKGIEDSFDIEDASIERIRDVVFDKIASIRNRFRKKRAEDQARLRKVEAEKAVVEKRLEDINRRYKEFSRQSKDMLEQMEKFRQLSYNDGLTKVYNRRAYDHQIQKTIDEFRKGALKTFCLIVFDIDHFKNFNNNYGHRAGDKVLKYVAQFARKTLRKEDFLFRYGGDEYTVILPEVTLKNAVAVAEKIRSAINNVEFQIYKESDFTVRVGLSMGVASSRKDDDPAAIFGRADKALYLSKEKGRNQVRSEAEL